VNNKFHKKNFTIMAKTDFKTIDEYHASQPAEAVERMQQIRDLIHQIVPEVEEVISYQIPCFKHKGYLIYYAAFPKHITISNPWSAAFLAHFEADLKGYKVSKSAIQLPADKPLPTELIGKIVAFRKQENEAAVVKKK
jgi:uncharacterized protein YdhG (YjbR/CyaY superfamily)